MQCIIVSIARPCRHFPRDLRTASFQNDMHEYRQSSSAGIVRSVSVIKASTDLRLRQRKRQTQNSLMSTSSRPFSLPCKSPAMGHSHWQPATLSPSFVLSGPSKDVERDGHWKNQSCW